jgi:hypothetical protein
MDESGFGIQDSGFGRIRGSLTNAVILAQQAGSLLTLNKEKMDTGPLALARVRNDGRSVLYSYRR